MPSVKLRKVGGSISAAIPPHILDALSLGAGSELLIEVDNGRVVMSPALPKGRIGIAARLAMCDFSVPLSPERQAEDTAWDRMKPVGREVIK
jgi:antitoxin component of MazEF toxin-antitoxin module